MLTKHPPNATVINQNMSNPSSCANDLSHKLSHPFLHKKTTPARCQNNYRYKCICVGPY